MCFPIHSIKNSSCLSNLHQSDAIKPLQMKPAQWDDAVKRAPVKAQMNENQNDIYVCFMYKFVYGYRY